MITGSTSHKLSDKLYYSEKNDNVGMLLISLLSGLVGCDFMVGGSCVVRAEKPLFCEHDRTQHTKPIVARLLAPNSNLKLGRYLLLT